MRHRVKSRRFARTSSHRLSMFRNMGASLVAHEMITTTLPKAKELRRTIEPLITISKTDTVANRRLVYARIRDKDAVKVLFEKIGPRFSKRPGGYVRVLKAGYRTGDSAPMALVQLLPE